MKSVFDEWLIMFERPASTVEKWYRITKVGEFLQQLVFSDALQGLLLMNCCVLCLHNRPVEQLYFFHSSSHITSSVPQVLPDNVRTSFSLCSSRFLSFSKRSLEGDENCESVAHPLPTPPQYFAHPRRCLPLLA